MLNVSQKKKRKKKKKEKWLQKEEQQHQHIRDLRRKWQILDESANDTEKSARRAEHLLTTVNFFVFYGSLTFDLGSALELSIRSW